MIGETASRVNAKLRSRTAVRNLGKSRVVA